MSGVTEGILIGAGSTLVAAFIVWAVACLFRRANIPNNVRRLGRCERAILGALEKMLLALRSYGAVNETMLEVIKDGRINGNIIKAIDRNTLGGEHLDVADEIIHDFLHDEATGQNIGKAVD